MQESALRRKVNRGAQHGQQTGCALRRRQPEVQEAAGNCLQRRGFEVITAEDPMEALRYFRMFCFDLALLDYHMSLLSGPGLAQKMKSIHSKVPIVMISGCAVLPDTELFFIDAHFGSDSSLDDLLATMRTLAGAQAVERNQAVAGDWSDST